MTMFLLGYAAAIATYLLIGAAFGAHLVYSNLARFFMAGFRWRLMAVMIGKAAILWPMLFVDATEPE